MNPRELTNEELAAAIRAIKSTGICPSRNEKEYLEEAARRLEEMEYDNYSEDEAKHRAVSQEDPA